MMKKQSNRDFAKLQRIKRSRAQRHRGLRMELLEGRQLMAADTIAPLHNSLIAADVNKDFNVSPLDALLVINSLNRKAAGSGEGEGSAAAYVDVSGDGAVSPLDALLVINQLNAEGEGNKLVSYTTQITDASGNPITSIAVGQTFILKVFVQDLRPAGSATGVFSAGVDVDLDGNGQQEIGNLVKFPSGATQSFLAGITPGTRIKNSLSGDFGGYIVTVPSSDAGVTANITDGTTFSINDGTRQIKFEFDNNGSATSGNQVVTIAPAASPAVVVNAIGNAIAAATTLKVTATSLGGGRLQIGGPSTGVAILPENSGLTFTGTDEDLNEISLLDGDVFAPPLAQRTPPVDPTQIEPFFSASFVALKPGTLTFTPNAADSVVGAETLLYDDGTAIPASSIMFAAPLSLTIQADPTAPVAVNDTVNSPEDTQLILGGAGANATPPLIQNDTVTSPRTLTVTAVAALASTKGTVSGLTYTPPANFNGQDLVTYTITDSAGLTSTATVTINVTPVNDPPVGVDDSFPIPGDSTLNPLDVLANDNAGGGETQTLTIISVSQPGHGTVVNNGTSVSYTPAIGFEGVDTFTYTFSDGQATATATVTLTVEPATTPFARRDTATIAEVSAGETGSVKINVLANDKVNAGAGIKATLISFTQPANGTVTLDDNGTPADLTDDQLVYVPNFEFNGTDTFTYVMNDTFTPQGANSTGTVVVTVTDVNDAPTAGNDNATGTEDTPVTIAISTLLANDSPGLGETTTQTLSVTAGTSASGTVAVVGSNVVFTPSPAVNGVRTFTYVVTDSGTPALTATGTVTVNLAAVNDAPIPVNDNVSTNEDTQVVITATSLLANDAPGRAAATDESTQTLSITAVSKPAATTGTVTLNAGNITYVPALNFNGTETFTYTVQDSGGASATGTVTVTVNPINDAPVAGADSVVAFKGASLQIPVASLLGNDTPGPANESNQTPLTITGVSGAVNGTVSLNSTTGVITFTPAAGFSGAASFQYTVQDSGPSGGLNVNTGTGTVNVTVRDFVPTTISGRVYVEETNDGVINPAERKLGGVEVTITGDALGVPIAQRTVLTLADGSYHFDNLAPGQYVVRVTTPAYHSTAISEDSPGSLGDADNIDNQFTINIAQPGGGDGSNYNFALYGLDNRYLSLFNSLLASNFFGGAANVGKGLLAVLGSDNSSIWLSKMDGFDNMLAGEVVLNSAGNRAQLTIVDTSEKVYTTTLTTTQFRVVTDNATGNRLVRIVGDSNSMNFQQVNMAAPPVVSYNRFLEAIDEVFAQEGWDGIVN